MNMIKSIDTSEYTPSPLDDGEGVSKKINVLRGSMSKLEEQILEIGQSFPVNQIKMARLRKIQDDIKNEIELLHSNMIPNLTA